MTMSDSRSGNPHHHIQAPKGPLSGIRIVEFAGIGPAPMTAMLLADLGAQVIRIDRVAQSDLGIAKPKQFDVLARGRPSVRIDLKEPNGAARALDIVRTADGLIEGFRPGVMERLGLGPEHCQAVNPRLVYGRVTGWGQEGPLSQVAGHDLNYIALTGALHASGRAGAPPTPPLNLVDDFGGGGLYLAFGIVCALLECRTSGRGQVVDAAIVDGAATLMSSIYGMFGADLHNTERGTNLLDSGAPHYEVYRCADGEYIAIAPIEAKFRRQLLRLLELDEETSKDFLDPANWASLKATLADVFLKKSRAEWCELLDKTDACFAPVLSMAEAPDHPHHQARGTFVDVDGVLQPAPGPRFSRSTLGVPKSARQYDDDPAKILQDWERASVSSVATMPREA